jgi:hypothetical protein
MVKPLNQFCCGCGLPVGVYFILFINFAQNVFNIANVTANVIFKYEGFGYSTPLPSQTFNAAWCLVGLCFIFSGVIGVRYRLEPHARMFLYYLLLTFIIDTIYMVMYLFLEDTCKMLPDVLASQGSAFACGFTRIITIAFMVLATAIEGYFVFTVWSFCEDLKIGGATESFNDLLESKGQTHIKHGSYQDGLFGVGSAADGPYPVHYGSIATPGIGGSTPIFGGSYHETEYPPKGF